MSPELAYRFFNKLANDHFSFIYMSEFDDNLTSTLMRVNETGVQEPQVIKNKLSFLIIECFQNIIRHADKPEIINRTNNKPKMFLIRNVGADFFIASTNLIDNQKKAKLVSKLNSINSSTQQELNEVYIDALANNEFSEKGGAGLGLIEMAKRSDCKLEFDFDFVNYFFSNFFMQLRVNTVNGSEGSSNNVNTIGSTKELYGSMETENIIMVRKGDFSQQSILPLLKLIETNLESLQPQSGLKKKILYLLVEMLQNVSKHAIEQNKMREGVFLIALKDNKFTLNTGNYIDIKEVEPLKAKLKNLVTLDQTGLAEIYKANILKKEIGPDGNAGMGLIEICKYSSEKIKFKFLPVNDTLSFFSLNVTM